MNKKYAFLPLAVLIALACSCPVALPNTAEIQSTPTIPNLDATAAAVDATTAALDATVAAVEAVPHTQAPPSPSPTSSPIPPAIPFQEDFTVLNRDWSLGEFENGEVFLSNGELHIINYTSAEFSQASFPGIDVADVTIGVESYLVGGSDDNWAEIFCRYEHGSSNHYFGGYSSDGYYYAGFQINDERDYFIEATVSSAINQGTGAKNEMLFECNGSRIRLWVNGILLVDVNDVRLNSGDIGLSVSSLDDEFSEVGFDDLWVAEP